MMASGVPGLLEWFRPGEEDRVEQVLRDVARLGVTRLRTGISWAEYCTPAGEQWYRWLLPRLARDLEVLPCLLHTPPSLGIRPKISSPPQYPRAFADWLDEIITKLGHCFEYIELWNEPNNLSEWDWTLDPNWLTFCEMVGAAAYWARQRGKKTVLGGMAPVDPQWLWLMIQRGVIENIDVVGVHAFPALWEAHWPGWNAQLQRVRDVLTACGCRSAVWITETGYSTWRHGEFEQLRSLLQAMEAPAERMYWYAVQDLHPDHGTVDGFHTDEREYHLGLKDYNGRPKLLYRVWAEGGLEDVRNLYELAKPRARLNMPQRPALITGGAGFIGARLAQALAERGRPVIIYDNLSRPGADVNLRRLTTACGPLVEPRIADIRDFYTVRDAVRECGSIFHLAAEHDAGPGRLPPEFEINLRGTLNLLENVRAVQPHPAFIAASTVAAHDGQGLCAAAHAAADRFVLNYACACGLPALVLRFGSTYGERIPGTPVQMLPADGDGACWELLCADDAVEALLAAEAGVEVLKGGAYAVLGGEQNRVTPRELDSLLDTYGVRRRFAVAGTPSRTRAARASAFQIKTGWRPKPLHQGLSDLGRWAGQSDDAHADNYLIEKGGHHARSRG